MEKNTALAGPIAGRAATAAQVSFVAAAAFLLLLAALHALKPEIDPSWRFISEYAIGDFGWMMSFAFLSLALSHAALFTAVASQARGLTGRIGLALLLIGAAGLVLAGIFTTDGITASPEEMTTQGALHNLGGTLGIVLPFAYGLISWSLARNPAWAERRRPLFLAAGLALAGFLVSFISMGIMLSQSGGMFGPDVPVGWPNRLEILTYCAWLLVASRQAVQLGKNQELSGSVPRRKKGAL